jgi:hypothetical protein
VMTSRPTPQRSVLGLLNFLEITKLKRKGIF